MKLSLLFPSWTNHFGAYKSAAKKISTFPPLNLCIIAALAKQEGWDVQIVDANVEELSTQALIGRVKKFSPDLIGLTATTPFFKDATHIAYRLKEHCSVPIIMGGVHVSLFREKAFEDCFDYMAIGECENSFPLFLRQFAPRDRYPTVPGIMARHRGSIMYQGDAPFVENLDESPLPERALLRNEKYVKKVFGRKKRYTSIQISRGCTFSCIFCANDLYGRHVRLRSVNNVMEELEYSVRVLGAEHVYFTDDVLTVDKQFMMALCAEIKKHELSFTFEGSTCAQLWDYDIAARLKESGLCRISFGLETIDPTVRQIIKKNIPLQKYIDANKINNKLGIETVNSVIIGLPGDTRESINNTITYLCTARDLHHVTLNIAMPYPGTEMLDMAEKGMHGLTLIEHDFSKYNRYGSAVMEVNGISPQELIDIQRKTLMKIYSCWWRFIPTIKRFGLWTVIITLVNLIMPIRKKQ